jgi:Glucosamine-6-phosphate isomerases/6-phosphogluconolactonase
MNTGPLTRASAASARRLDQRIADSVCVVERLWQRDHQLWKTDPTEIANRLGWLTVIGEMQAQAASDPEVATLNYERLLRIIDGPTQKDSTHLDLLLLGLAQDGHTASLYPGTKAVSEHQRLVAIGQAPTGIMTRLTLTLGVINRASVVMFVGAGADKARIVKSVLKPGSDADRLLPWSIRNGAASSGRWMSLLAPSWRMIGDRP